MSPLIISIAVFLAVATLVGAMTMMFRGEKDSKIEGRLNLLTSAGPSQKEGVGATVIAHPLDAVPSVFDLLAARFGEMGLLFEQADTNLTAGKFFAICGVLGAGAALTSL